VLEIGALGMNARWKNSTSLVNSHVDNVLVKSAPDLSQPLCQFIVLDIWVTEGKPACKNLAIAVPQRRFFWKTHGDLVPRNLWKTGWLKKQTRSSADADNGLDAFVGQSRSKNILNPFQVK